MISHLLDYYIVLCEDVNKILPCNFVVIQYGDRIAWFYSESMTKPLPKEVVNAAFGAGEKGKDGDTKVLSVVDKDLFAKTKPIRCLDKSGE
jgi:hypothetical protein